MTEYLIGLCIIVAFYTLPAFTMLRKSLLVSDHLSARAKRKYFAISISFFYYNHRWISYLHAYSCH